MVPNVRALLIISVISFASNWQFGYQITYINTAAPDFYNFANTAYREHQVEKSLRYRNETLEFQNTSSLTYEQWSGKWSLVVSSFYPGTFLGFVLVPFLIRRIGVRQSLLFSAYPAVAGCFIQLFVQHSSNVGGYSLVLNLMIGRFLVGVQAGCSLCLLPLFIIEASTEKHRPFLSSLQQVSQALSTLIGLLVGSDSILPLGPLKIQWLQVFGIVPICIFIIVLVLLPETPLHLLEESKKREVPIDPKMNQEIIKSANFYYGDFLELSSVQENAFDRWDNMEEPELANLATYENLKGLLIGSLAAISFAFTADDIIDSYSSQLLYRSADGSGNNAQKITVFLGVWLLIASIFGAFVIDRFGRKRVLIFGLVGTAFSNLLAALGSAQGSVAVVTTGFTFTKTFIGVGAGGPAWFLTSELVSPSVICICQSISTGSLLIMTGIITLCFLPMQVAIGGSYSIVMLASTPALLVALLLVLLLPETKDKSYQEIRQQLKAHHLSGISSSTSSTKFGDPSNEYYTAEGEKSVRYHRLMSNTSYASYGSFKHIRNSSVLSTSPNINYPNNNYENKHNNNNVGVNLMDSTNSSWADRDKNEHEFEGEQQLSYERSQRGSNRFGSYKRQTSLNVV